MNKYICIHGHFYQPPRENPWLETIEMQDSAYPFHDWNARITAECYGPNATSRILAPDGKIQGIMNNYSRISFNMGPTLLSWMEQAEPIVYDAIVEGDRTSLDIHPGHGSAIAQVYNHMIMPLADDEDKRTQVLWGIFDFKKRFGRDPEGMWLAETAVNIATLEVLAENGIVYTILAPRQAARIRKGGDAEWTDVSDGSVDPRRPYRCKLPSGKEIVLFFYDGPIAQDLAFGGLLHDGVKMADRLMQAFGDDNGEEPLLVHVAADGETFGHHHKKGDMALSYCIYHIEKENLAEITVYGEFLEKFPPTWEAEIIENTSWSCIHGIERWRSDCGCCSGGHADWNQKWRKPLREALDFVRDTVKGYYAEAAKNYFADPAKAREAYIQVILERTPENVARFLEEHKKPDIEFNDDVKNHGLRLLEILRQSLLMYTSCGWFFDEISGLETTQVMRYASRAIQLMQELGGPSIEDEFVARLAAAESNIPDLGNGAEVYNRYVKPASVDLRRVGIHYAVSSVFDDFEDKTRIFAFDVERKRHERLTAGRLTLVLGQISLRSLLTYTAKSFDYAVLHLGDQNLTGGIREVGETRNYDEMSAEFRAAFSRSDVPEIIRLIDRHFDMRDFSFWHLFMDQQRRIMNQIFRESENSIENFYRQVYRDQYPLMSAMKTMGIPLPKILRNTVDYVLNRDLLHELETLPIDEEKFKNIQGEIKKWNSTVDGELIGYVGGKQLAAMSDTLAGNPLDVGVMREMSDLLGKYGSLGVPLTLWHTQDRIYDVGLQQFPIRKSLADQGDQFTKDWVEQFEILSNLAGVHVE